MEDSKKRKLSENANGSDAKRQKTTINGNTSAEKVIDNNSDTHETTSNTETAIKPGLKDKALEKGPTEKQASPGEAFSPGRRSKTEKEATHKGIQTEGENDSRITGESVHKEEDPKIQQDGQTDNESEVIYLRENKAAEQAQITTTRETAEKNPTTNVDKKRRLSVNDDACVVKRHKTEETGRLSVSPIETQTLAETECSNTDIETKLKVTREESNATETIPVQRDANVETCDNENDQKADVDKTLFTAKQSNLSCTDDKFEVSEQSSDADVKILEEKPLTLEQYTGDDTDHVSKHDNEVGEGINLKVVSNEENRSAAQTDPPASTSNGTTENNQQKPTPDYPHRYLFRVNRDDETPTKDGIRAKRPHANISVEDHVRYGSNKGQYYESQYISTSAGLDECKRFRNLRNRNKILRHKPTPDIVKIDCEGLSEVKYIDLTKVENRDKYLTSEKAKDFALSFREVLIEGYVPAKHCTVAN